MIHLNAPRIIIFCLILTFITASASFAEYHVSAKGVLFSNSTRAKRYYGKNVHNKVLPASTVKIMTALLVLEHLPLSKIITVSPSATKAQPSKIYAKSGDKYTVKHLLYALLLKSANDAAIVLAEAVAGSERKFVQMMNDKAQQLGAKHTKFANANGLPSPGIKQYTTPYDMYLIFREAIKDPFFCKTLRMKQKTIHSLSGQESILTTHNKLLLKDWKYSVYGKTGWTNDAQQCFVGYLEKGNNIYIISLFGATARWQDIEYIISRYGKITL